MNLIFKGGGELVGFKINRSERKFSIVSSKTDYKLEEKPWKFLFDKGKEQMQDKITERLNDDEFIKAIELSMNENGYILKEIKND